MAEMVYLVDANARARRCTFLGKRLNHIAKDMFQKTNANVAVFVRSYQGRQYHYTSHVPRVDAVMDEFGMFPGNLTSSTSYVGT
ncbi:hypothetical protein F2Q68_00028257 [Brassica cretica]|uniref:Uncharacterized protein n=1 Tax=Brassica cretica TaxID=69181 RepID=A0A8S9I7E8_BRACR|nr:hypothetical protein F2Q68_00028257 [Brassica cretica]